MVAVDYRKPVAMALGKLIRVTPSGLDDQSFFFPDKVDREPHVREAAE